MRNLTVKTCFACKVEKPVAEFYKCNARYYQRECKACTRARKQAWHKTESGKASSANTKLKSRFGIDQIQYNSLLAAQGGLCAICAAPHSYGGHKLAVDHNHKTGAVRGLLCKACNVGIGNLRDSPAIVAKALVYLGKYEP